MFMLEPFVNQDMVRQLGKMGVEVYKTMFLTDYVKVHLQRTTSVLSGVPNKLWILQDHIWVIM